jgi:hypothetical protein
VPFHPITFFQQAAGGYAQTYAIDLTASSTYCSITDAAQSGLDLSTFTIEVYLKHQALPGSGNFRTIWYKWASGQKSIWFTYANDSGVYKFKLFGSDDGVITDFQLNWTYSVSAMTWHHVALTYDSASQLSTAATLYVNGSSQGNGTIVGGTGTTTYVPYNGTSVVGVLGNPGSGYLTGYAVDYRVFDVVRSGAQIAAGYTSPAVGDESGLVSLWRFDGDATDSVGSNNLTENGSVAYVADTPY